MTKFNSVVCGGTFDLLHAGHKSFILDVLSYSKKITLGITSDVYIKSFKNYLGVVSFEIRKNAVEDFLKSINAKEKVKITEINSAYEPYLETSTDYQAIIVTGQTKEAAIEINKKRKQNGISELEVVLSPMKKSDDGKIISSTRIRNGEINREGRLYVNPKWKNKTLVLPEILRSELQHPWGEVLGGVPENIQPSKTIVIGDIVTLTFNKNNVGQFLSIVDFVVQRQLKFHELSELNFSHNNIEKARNPHGTITSELLMAIEKAFKKNTEKKIILVDGEEDLAVLPVLLCAPLGYSIFYGQPNVGMVQVLVTEESKAKAYSLVDSFDLRDQV
jgi:pantetheine-phosphate adenylyltransferase